ncbi:hypothetical protein C7296_12975 [Burkholderia thailandensis]|nr:hypothetical protein WJ27_01235 [Burkholderia thailandensis]NOK42308.1 hypothetical protein [Burkholderia thailandensis]NOK54690.1 hypothetical protein [Burkholderia thailandensis]PNE69343.1 hypothetical protein A8H38_25730 [Burkholderia thailandensis]PNE81386.1 hypothetical protein A8H34_26530 [Burkholderia thailandensis]
MTLGALANRYANRLRDTARTPGGLPARAAARRLTSEPMCGSSAARPPHANGFAGLPSLSGSPSRRRAASRRPPRPRRRS